MALDEAAIVQTLMAERVRLLAYIWSIVHDAHLVEDVFQEVSLLAINKRSELCDEKTLAGWLRGSARLVSIAAMRRKERHPILLREEVLDQLDAAWRDTDDVSAEETLGLLRRCLAALSERSRQFVALRYVDRLTSSQVAEKLDITVHSVYVALGRIHRTLRECIQRQREHEGAPRG
jgi:RNA polymerase sigma-70 factor, ECF subfamily